MSASEKLKALIERLPESDNTDYWGWNPDGQALYIVLPQIVAVVEAAEAHAEPINQWGQTKLGHALSALEEALS